MPIIITSGEKGKPHSTKEGRKAESKRTMTRSAKAWREKATGKGLLEAGKKLLEAGKKSKSGGSSILDVFKSYGKYSGKPIELKGGGKAIKGLGRAFQKGGKV